MKPTTKTKPERIHATDPSFCLSWVFICLFVGFYFPPSQYCYTKH